MYRPEIRVLDCTIRDGGLMNKWDFSHEVVRKVYEANIAAGIDYMEIGYRASTDAFDPKEYGPWRFCNEDDLRRITDGIDRKGMKLSMMVDIGRCKEGDILPCEETVLDTIRVACYVKEIDKAIALANHCQEKGYEMFVNIMAISNAVETVLDECLHQVEEETNVKGVYVVDSFGNLDLEETEYLVSKYRKICKTKEVGYHAHNNQQLAYANTMLAIIKNANYLDGSYYGIGRAAGNCPIELLLGFLKNPKFDVRPILDVISEVFVPLMEELNWGYRIPYAITGMLNEHPRSAMALMNSDDRHNYREFYDQLTSDDSELV